jgi:hypothetical protein
MFVISFRLLNFSDYTVQSPKMIATIVKSEMLNAIFGPFDKAKQL